MSRFLRYLLVVLILLPADVLRAADIWSHLCKVEDATHTAVAIEGSWQDASTWSPAEVPPTGSRVCIPCNHFVTNHGVTADLQWLRVDGVLKVCDHCDTQINVHTLRIPMHGVVMLGEPDMPIEATAVLEFVPGTAVGIPGGFLPDDFEQFSLGLLCDGMFTACGTDKTAWLEVEQAAEKNATSVTPVDLSYNWMPGDDILIAGTDSLDGAYGEDRVAHKYQSEILKIASVNLRTINLMSALKYRHFPWRSDLRYHVANLSRNVVIRSRDDSFIGNRGHMMFMSPMNDIRYALVKGLGRTDKSEPITDPRRGVGGSDANPRGRYADHNHKNGPLTDPSIRRWVVYRDSPGWLLVNHASHCQWDNCIAMEAFGAAFVTEEGQERGHMRRCLAALNRGMGEFKDAQGRELGTDHDHGIQSIGDWGKDGSGFWNHSGLVEISDCVSVDNSGRGFGEFKRTFNSYPTYGSPPNPDATVAWIKSPVLHDVTLLGPEYADLPQHFASPHAPASTVPQRVFARNTAYGVKVGVQGWNGPTIDADGKQIWPLSVRGSITDLTLWGRGSKLHLEYTRQMNVTGLKVVGDLGFRPQWNSLSRISEAVLLRNPEITITDWSIENMPCAPFTIEQPSPSKNIVIENWP